MNALLRLYPPAWRRRYGEEITELLSKTPVSLTAALDLLRGATDAWLHPSLGQPQSAYRSGFRQAMLILAVAVFVSQPQLAHRARSRHLGSGSAIGA
jgi:hypothetical protein